MKHRKYSSQYSQEHLVEHLASYTHADPAKKQRFHLAFASAIWLTLAAIWLPGLGFSNHIIEVAKPRPKESPRETVFAPKPIPMEKKPELLKPKQIRVPMPDRFPQEPEPEISMIELADESLFDDSLLALSLDLEAAPSAPPDRVYDYHMPGLELPVFRVKVPPKYPRRAIAVGIQGYVLVEAILGKNGQIRDIKVLRGLGRGRFGFEEAAMEAIKQWQFLPGQVNGKSVDIRMNLRITFALQR